LPSSANAAGGKKADAIIRHADLWGTRESKYGWLDSHDLKQTDWKEVLPTSPFYLYAPRDNALDAQYRRFVGVPDLFPVNSVGIVTARDDLTIHWSKEEVWKTVTLFPRMDEEVARQGYKLGKDARDWKVALAQKDLLDSGPDRGKIAPILYRPFDVRYTYYTGRSRGFICMPRPEVMRHMLAGENLALITPKRVEHVGAWQHAFVSNATSDHVAVSLKTIDYHFPLYLYPTSDRANLFSQHERAERRPNLNPKGVAALEQAYGTQPSPEEIFHYVYAVLYAPAYREKYAAFLRMDFPRVPFTADAKLFRKLATLGEKLVALHLLKSPDLDPPACRFEGEGDSRVGRDRKTGLRYDPDLERVYINAAQHFAPVPEAVWTYKIGGYQVCEKWLKDRRERRLELDDIRTYCRIVTALGLTIAIQAEIDTLYPDIEKKLWPCPIEIFDDH